MLAGVLAVAGLVLPVPVNHGGRHEPPCARPHGLFARATVASAGSRAFHLTASAADDDERPAQSEVTAITPAEEVVEGETTPMTASEVERVGNLVEDDEWLGLTTELTIVLRSALRETIKKSTREFTGSDEYKIGDLSKEADARIKATVAEMRGKEDYELGDLSIALDGIVKEEVNKMTGKDEYEFGDLSIELDTRVKKTVADFCGKDEYTPGDLSREIGSRVAVGVKEFTGKGAYEFGDVSKEIERRRVRWVKEVIGKEDYQFGDITKTAISNFTGKDEYEFGDISKRLGQVFFGNKPKKSKKPDQ